MKSQTIKNWGTSLLDKFRPSNIVMYHLGRCGSTVLGSLLDQNPRIYWDGELYTRFFLKGPKENNGESISGILQQDPMKILQRRMLKAFHRHYGTEIKPFHFSLMHRSPQAFIESLDLLKFNHVIILDRRNRLRKIISSLIGKDQKKYHLRSGESPKLNRIFLNTQQVTIDSYSKSLVQCLSDYDEQFAELEKILGDRKILKLIYEDDIESDPIQAYQKVCDFINVKPHNAEIKFTRTNPFPVRDLIENFSEVEGVLRGTPYEWMLHD
jgi:hypothetical protein